MSELEIWKPVKNIESKYEVSSLGNIRNSKGVILKPCLGTNNYLQVTIRYLDKIRTRTIHQLVAESFLNYTPEGVCDIVVDHIDNNKVNNKVENLNIISRRTNTHKEKIANSHSIYKGVSFDKQRSLWKSYVFYKGKTNHLGFFNNEEEAYKEYLKAVELIEKGLFNSIHRSSSSQYKNIYKTKHDTWVAHKKTNGKDFRIGTFKTELEAYQALLEFLNNKQK